MQHYPVRGSHRGNLQPNSLHRLMAIYFENARESEGGVEGGFGAISRIHVKADRKELAVELTMDPKVSPELQQETIHRYNRFLEEATGYTSKERSRRLRKSVQGADAE